MSSKPKQLRSRKSTKGKKKKVTRNGKPKIQRTRSNFHSEKSAAVNKEDRLEELLDLDDDDIDITDENEQRRGAVMLAEDEVIEVVDVIKVALEMSLLGQKALIDFLFRDETQEDLANAGDEVLIDSLDQEFYDGLAPTSVRGAMLWRFASTIWDFPCGKRKTNLKLALTAFDLMLEWCDPYEHPIHYAALQNSLEQAENAFHRVVLADKLEKGNDETRWDIVVDDEVIPRKIGMKIFGQKTEEEKRREERAARKKERLKKVLRKTKKKIRKFL